jgi:hypothetical protein
MKNVGLLGSMLSLSLCVKKNIGLLVISSVMEVPEE